MLIIDKGNLLYDGTLTELKAMHKTRDLEEIIKKIYLNGMPEDYGRQKGAVNA